VQLLKWGRLTLEERFDKMMISISPSEQVKLMDELHRVAKRYMFKENAGHTLQATALVNEAYVKLAGKTIDVSNKHHFIALAARQMRRILVDHARQKLTDKRDSPAIQITLANVAGGNDHVIELIHVDKLLKELSSFDARAAQVYELKIFSALTNAEIASILGISLATVERDAKVAKAWLKVELQNTSS
jgi:RNA polymerase sigma factor (TIGR02999 family)